MSKFYKIVLFLLLVLFLELIFIGNRPNIKKKSGLYEVSSYSPEKSILIFIDLTTGRMEVSQEGKVINAYPICTEEDSFQSTIGTFYISDKKALGNGLGGRWMGLSIPWGKYGIYGIIFPDFIGSSWAADCIRMKNSDAAELYGMISCGTKVIIYGGPYGCFGDNFRVIKPGFRGSDVFQVQRLLKGRGYFSGDVNGIYGDNMKSSIYKFEKDNELTVSDNISYSFYEKLGVEMAE